MLFFAKGLSIEMVSVVIYEVDYFHNFISN